MRDGENLSECALARIPRTLSQILARIIEVWVIGQIGKAAFELEHDSVRDPEVLSQPQGEVNGSGANKRPHGRVAKAANNAAVARPEQSSVLSDKPTPGAKPGQENPLGSHHCVRV